MKSIEVFYQKEYQERNPGLHREDSSWKIKKILEILPKETQVKRLMDMGCGAGWILLGISEALGSEKRIGIDYSEYMLREAQKSFPSGNYIRANATVLPLRDQSIDLSLLIDIIEHLEDPAAALREQVRISKYIVVKVPLEGCFLYRVLHFLKIRTTEAIIRDFGHIQVFNRGKIERLIYQSGFCILRHKIISHNVDVPDNIWLSRKARLINPLRILTYRISEEFFATVWGGFSLIWAKNVKGTQ